MQAWRVVSLGGIHVPPYVWMPPIHLDDPIYLYAPIPPVHLYVLLVPYVPHMSRGLGGNLYTPYNLGSFGGISTSVRHFGVCWYIHYLSVQKSHASAPHHCGFLLYWTWCLWMSAMLHAVVPFFVVFIMFKASTTMVMTTTPLVTVVSSGLSSLLTMVTIAPSLMGLPTTSGQHDVVLPPPLIPRHSRGVVGLATVLQQQPPSQMPL